MSNAEAFSHPMVVASEGATVRDCLLAIQRGGGNIALLVDRDRGLAGIVTDGDLRRAWLEGVALDDDASPLIRDSPLVVSQGESRGAILDLMRVHGISQVPEVSADGRLTGIHLMREVIGRPRLTNHALIMAGGKGTRLGPLSERTPKPMLRVAGRPIIERLVTHLVGHGVTTIHIAVSHLAEQVVEHLGDGTQFGCSIDYLWEDPKHPLGTGGPIAALWEATAGGVDEPLFVLNGDLITEVDITELLRHHMDGGFDATITTSVYSHQVPFGVVTVSDGATVERIDEKPVRQDRVSSGIYVLEPRLCALVDHGRDVPMTEVLQLALDREWPVGAYACDDDWIDVGRPEDLKRARGSE